MTQIDKILSSIAEDVINLSTDNRESTVRLVAAFSDLIKHARYLEKNQKRQSDPEESFGDAQSGEKVAEAVLESVPSPALDFTGVTTKNLNISFTNYTSPEKGEKGDRGDVGYMGAMGMQGPPGPKGDPSDPSGTRYNIVIQGKVGQDVE